MAADGFPIQDDEGAAESSWDVGRDADVHRALGMAVDGLGDAVFPEKTTGGIEAGAKISRRAMPMSSSDEDDPGNLQVMSMSESARGGCKGGVKVVAEEQLRLAAQAERQSKDTAPETVEILEWMRDFDKVQSPIDHRVEVYSLAFAQSCGILACLVCARWILLVSFVQCG